MRALREIEKKLDRMENELGQREEFTVFYISQAAGHSETCGARRGTSRDCSGVPVCRFGQTDPFYCIISRRGIGKSFESLPEFLRYVEKEKMPDEEVQKILENMKWL